jgi:hypothetical protein
MATTLPRDIRLTDRQTAQLIGTNLGEILKLSARSGKYHDPTFPPKENGTRCANAVLAWIAARDAKATNPEGSKNG